MKKIKEIIGMLSKKQKIIALVSIILFVVAIFVIEELAFPRINVRNLKDNYEYSDFMEEQIKLSSSLFVSKKETIWNMNGYDFAKGKEHGGLPVIIGENTLKITNGNLEKTYVFTIENSEQSFIVFDEEFKIDSNYIDYDGDGIPNITEKELGLATYTNDTDEDGLLDNVELIMGLDPTKEDNYNEVREYKIKQDNSKSKENYLMVTGKGNIANTFLDTAELNIGLDSNLVKSDVLKIVTSNSEKPKNMDLYMKKKSQIKEEDYSIYTYDEKRGSLEELETIISGDYFVANTLLFDNFYFLGNKKAAPTGEYINQIMILLDNSGSMYTLDYVAEKRGVSMDDERVLNENLDDYSNDVDFKRLELMDALVSRLGSKDYEYSVYAFTGDYYDIVEKSTDLNQVKKGINSLRTEYQNFNGTELSGAIRNYTSKFNNNVYGKKIMIVLTDGNDSENFFSYKVSDSKLESYRKDGINIITIGLGKGVNSEYLMNIANKTNGKYLYASDANMLETLIELIESKIENQKTTEIDGEKVILLADSGFEVARDSFSFSNFSSVGAGAEGGNCYGFSQLTKAIYLNQLKDSAKEEKNLRFLGR